MKNFKLSACLLLAFFCAATAAFSQQALKRANKEYELSAYDKALKNYQEVLDKTPKHNEANTKIADCYRRMNQLEKAAFHYEKALQNGGLDNLYVFQYGLTQQGLGRYEQAKETFDRLADNSAEFSQRAKQFSEACAFAEKSDEAPLFKINAEFSNTPSMDFGAALYKDRVIYASNRSDLRNRDGRGMSGNTGDSRLFITQRDKNNFLETPVTLHAGFRNDGSEGPVAYSSDGRWVAVTKNNFKEGLRQVPSGGTEMQLHLAQVSENGDWNNATPFSFNGSDYSSGYAAFSSDGSELYFSSDRPGGFGGFDLYVSYRTGDSWSSPENLGIPVNTMGSEIAPFHDGTSLYFASDYHRGFGGFDIFRAEESNKKWATVYHGGSGLNSSADDYGFVFDPLRNIGYFVSNRPGGKGNEDIYRVLKESDNVTIRVTDAANGKPIEGAVIDFSDCGDRKYSSNANGAFNFQLVENLNCLLQVSKEGYLAGSVRLTSSGAKQSRTLDVALTNATNAYKGKTSNGYNGFVLEDVKVIAVNQKNSEATETFSDQQGNYYIAMQPNTNYVLRFSKAGFKDFSLNFKTAEKDAKNIGNVELAPVGSSGSSTGGSSGGGSGSGSGSGSSGEERELVGYSVQLASSSASDVDLSPFEAKLKGQKIFKVSEGGKSKVRAGVFKTRKEAEAVLPKAKKAGYSGAYIVEETAAVKPPKEEPQQPKDIPQSKNLDGYMVRIATLSNPDGFDKTKVADIGVVTFFPKGKVTVILLTGYDDMESAEIGLRKAKARGFTDAFVVVEDRGELVKPR